MKRHVLIRKFTFHNVSINSFLPQEFLSSAEQFTFHNVSINSLSRLRGLVTFEMIYIP